MCNIYVSHGNLSEDKDTTIFNLPAITTCPNHGQCSKTCYARKAEKRFKAVCTSRGRNLQATKDEHFVDDMVTILQKGKSRRVRIHESGDFYSNSYIKSWKKIISKLPGIQFKAFTKVEKAYQELHELPNLAIHSSVLPGGEINYGDDLHLKLLIDKYKAFKCPKKGLRRADGKLEHSCEAVGCEECWNRDRKYIVFKKH